MSEYLKRDYLPFDALPIPPERIWEVAADIYALELRGVNDFDPCLELSGHKSDYGRRRFQNRVQHAVSASIAKLVGTTVNN